jgi:hypothetical protein
VPLFVFDDVILGSAFARPNRVTFLLDALRDLDTSLTERGVDTSLRFAVDRRPVPRAGPPTVLPRFVGPAAAWSCTR